MQILLAEDNLINQKLAAYLFKSLGYENLVIAIDGKEAVENVTESNFDIIFMDINMPVMGGIEAAKKIRDLGHKMPIIAMTAIEDSEIEHELKEAGIEDFIPKPVGVDHIKNVMNKYF